MTRFNFSISVLFLLIFVQTTVFSQGTWTRVNVPTNQYLKSVCFVDSLYGWISGDSGTIIHTIDGGNTWIHQATQTNNEIPVVFFLNRNLGWAASYNSDTSPYGTILMKTTNGGATWQSQPYPVPDLFMTCILFTDPLHGWMGGKPNAIVKTTDGGVTWNQAAIDTSILAFFPILDIQFYDQKYGYACGGILDIAGVIWRTTNGGDSWSAMDPAYAPADEVHRLHLFDSLNVMGAGGDPDFGYGVGMIRTSDGGSIWTYDELDIQGNAYDLDFRNTTEAWAPLGPKRKLIYSLDSGLTWTPVPTPDSTAIYDMTFPDSIHGFAVGKNGAFIKYHPPVIPSVTTISSNTAGFTLFQNYPNPFPQETTIKIVLPDLKYRKNLLPDNRFETVRVIVFDVMGTEVASLKVRDVAPGVHELAFDAGNLPGGCYFYSLQENISGHFLTVAGPKRMIILRDK